MFDPCACFDKKKSSSKKSGKKGKREKGGMDSEKSEVVFERLKGGMDSVEEYDWDECYEMERLKGGGIAGCNACNNQGRRKKCKCTAEPEPEPEPPYVPPPPICPPISESQVVRKATPDEEGEYDEFEANLNGTGITIRVLKNSHTVTDVLDSENEDSGCEMNEICGKVSYFRLYKKFNKVNMS